MRTIIVCLLAVSVPALAAGSFDDDARTKKDLAALEGTWKLVSLEVEGKAMELPEKPPVWVIKGNRVRYGAEDLATLTLDATVTPKTVDLAFLNPKRVFEGVYSIEGDTLKVCANRTTEGAKERPTGFATEGKPELRLLVFARDKDGKSAGAENLTGFVGIALRADEERKELVLQDVLDGSPAKKAGLMKDDVLVKIGDLEATDLQAVVRQCRQAKPGSELTVRVKRDGKERDVVVKVGVFPFTLLD
jgi:uncharacterized protein (TIGR03067 family)